ncbi:hypothetical protein GJAV_G00104020 [Gymnothorax javanicus]|nr:hypothetical protein GJAV_G00104020 [Gymnothorax javanicus]
MSDSNLFMECEEEELEPWQQSHDVNLEEVVTVSVNKQATTGPSTAVPTESHLLAPANPIDTTSAAPPAEPTALQCPPVVMTVNVNSDVNRNAELATVAPCSTVPEPTAAPMPPPATPISAAEFLRSLVTPAVPHLKPAQQLVLTQTPAPPNKLPLSKVLHPTKPVNLAAGQSVIFATQDAPQSQIVSGAPLPSTSLDLGLQFKSPVAGQNTLNPVGFLLNGQAFFSFSASGTQLFKPAIVQALSQPTNMQPVTTATSLPPATVVTNQLQETLVSEQAETTLASGETATSATDEQAAIVVADKQPKVFVNAGQPGIAMVSQQPGIVMADELGGIATSNGQTVEIMTFVEQEEITISNKEAEIVKSVEPVGITISKKAETVTANERTGVAPAGELAGIASANEQAATSAASQHPLQSFTKQIPATVTSQSSSSISQGGKPSTLNAKPGHITFILPKVAENRPFNPDVKKLIKAVNDASTHTAHHLKTAKVIKPSNKPTTSNLATTPTTQSKFKVLPPKPMLGNKMCPRCGAQYRMVEALRGLLCLCSPEITQGLLAIGAAGASNVRPAIPPSTAASTKALPQTPAAATLSQKPTAPKVGATACMALSPSHGPSSPDEGELAEAQGKLIMLVDDFYYGRDEGQGAPEGGDASQQGPVQYRCLRCDKKLKNNIRLMNHLRHHIDSEQQIGEVEAHSCCQHCFRQFPSPFRLQCHLEAVHSQYESTTKCKICEWAFDSEPVFLQHMKNSHSAGEMPYVCQVCEFRSSIYSEVVSHFRSRHKDTACLLCPYCLKVFKTNGNYQHHYSRHQRKSVYHCDKCRLQFLCSKEKADHKVNHHKSFRKPWQLEGLKSGTKVTIRAYAQEKRVPGALGKPEPSAQAVTPLATPSPTKKQPIAKRQQVCTTQDLLVKFQNQRPSLGKQSCLECTFDIPEFSSHFPTFVSCSFCHYCTCCSRAYANHMINNHVSRKTSTKYLALFKAGPRWAELVCSMCGYFTQVGDQMATHLVKNPSHVSSYCTLTGTPPAWGQRSLSHGDSDARTPESPDGGQADQHLPVSTNARPLPGPECSDSYRDDGNHQGNKGPPVLEGQGEGSTMKLRVMLFALCCGVPRAAQRFCAPPQLIWSWLLEREKGAGPAGGDGREEDLVLWVLNRREQQLPVHEKNLFRCAQGLLGPELEGSNYGRMVDFLLRWRLGVQATGTIAHPLPAAIKGNVQKFAEYFRRLTSGRPLSAIGTVDEMSIFVNFDLLSRPSLSPERKQFAFHLAGTGVSFCDIILSATADGTLLPVLVFPSCPAPDPLRLPPNVLLVSEPAEGSFSAVEQLVLWETQAWQRCGASAAGCSTVLLMDGFRGHNRSDFVDLLRKAGTLTAVIPPSCSSRLQPLEMCIGPAFRGFLEARWSQLVAEGGVRSKATPTSILQQVIDWLGEALEGLGRDPELVRRSFRCTGLVPAETGDGDAAEMQQELLRSLTEVLMGPRPGHLVPSEEGQGGGALDTSIGSSTASPRHPPLTTDPQALRSIFEKDSDVESFLGFDETEISAAFGQ